MSKKMTAQEILNRLDGMDLSAHARRVIEQSDQYTVVALFGECYKPYEVENVVDCILEDYHWTEDTFGAMLPVNWEEICEAANDYMDENGFTEEDSSELWEKWCAEDEDILKVIPAARFEEVEA